MSMVYDYLKQIRHRLRDITGRRARLDLLQRQIESARCALGRIELRQLRENDSANLHEHEFQVFSQWGEDGIIQYLISRIKTPIEKFVEFGVQDYTEANTRFLLQNNNWSGLIIDSSPKFIGRIKRDPICWRHNLKTDCEFVECDNINEILTRNGMAGEIGLLSIDIDGNDYWIWKAITAIRPQIVVCEYNSLFGDERAVTIPYQRNFVRHGAHWSGAYFGASIAALARLGREKGYALVGSNSTGVNAFFIRSDLAPCMAELTPAQAYVRCQFRDSLDSRGRPTFSDFEQRLALILDLPLYDVDQDRVIEVRDIVS